MKIDDFPKFANHDFPTFLDYLEERGLTERTNIGAEKLAIAREIAAEMKKNKITKVEMASRMGTSRAQLDRVLSAQVPNAKLETLAKAARIVGKRLHISLI
jgi:antitoxin HicB